MATECNSGAISLQGSGGREFRAAFDGGDISSDGGVVLLRATEARTEILDQFAQCFDDYRDPRRTEHSIRDLVGQRVFGIALGYEDLNDHDVLRLDPLLAAAIGKQDPKGSKRARQRDRGVSLAGSSTLNRIELSRPEAARSHRYKRVVLNEEAVDDLFIDLFAQSFRTPPKRIVLDVDATDDPLHGNQEGRFFHGYYGHYCYMPLYIFCGDQLLAARLRPSNIDGSAGTVEELKRIVFAIRGYWPEVEILVRGDSGFCREAIMEWCESESVDYVFGLARNQRLEKLVSKSLNMAKRKCKKTGKPARYFQDFDYRTKKSWSRTRRVVAKAEHLPKGRNPRFIVTSMTKRSIGPKKLYETVYCARGDMENRIKEQQLFCFADRTSAHTIRANQVRLYFSSIAYTMLDALRRIGLQGSSMARAQCNTIRSKLLKIATVVRVTARKVWLSMSRWCPHADIFRFAMRQLRAPPAT